MDRKLAFRTWHPKLNRMVYDIHAGRGGIDWQDEKGKWWYLDDEGIEQFIGLQDKNGKDIYQSDILELNCLGWGGPYKDRVVVVWEGFGWYFRFSDGRLQPVEQKWQSECEVIGNIWENPELIQNQSQH